MNNIPDKSLVFTGLLLDVQRSLYGYILSLYPSGTAAKDILQQTNLVLLKKQSEYDPSGNFGAWAARIAYYEVLAYRKAARRDRLLFSDDLIQSLAAEGATDVTADDPQMRALDVCFRRLEESDRELIQLRYRDEKPAREIAAALGRTPHAISQSLYRIRTALLNCIQRRLHATGAR
jgi:RNA polymerase sigma-70 factor (ECF subfamily)